MKKFSLKSGLILAGCGFLLYLAIHYWPGIASFFTGILSAAMPLFLGLGVAYIINIIMAFYERTLFGKAKKKAAAKLRRPVSLILALVSMLAVVCVIIGLVLPQLISCIQLIIGMLPGAIDRAIDLVGEYHLLSDEVLAALDAIDWKSRVEQLMDVVTSGFTDVVSIVFQALQGVVSGVITAFLSFIFALYLLVSKEKLKNQADRLCKNFLPAKIHTRLLYIVYNLNVSFRRYLIGQSTEAVILGLLCAAGMLILRLPYAAMISALIAFTALIPVAGAYIGAFVGAFMILTVSPVKALIFLVFLVILQQLEGNLIYPRVVGSSLGLPGIWVLAAVTVGGGIAGVAGMFLGVPLVAAIYHMLRDSLNQKEAENAPPAKTMEESPAE